MKPKERILAAMAGRVVDRVPWSPFLAYYWESLPMNLQEAGQIDYLENMGADPLLRGSHQLFSVKRDKCIVRETVKGNRKCIVYETPAGSLQEQYVYTAAGNTWFITEHPVKCKEDFKILACLNDDMTLTGNMETFRRDYQDLGDRGLFLPVIGSETKTSFQSLVEHWSGTQGLVYALADYPEAVEACLDAMRRNSIDSVKLSVKSPAEAFIFWEDSSTTNISPAYFQKYAAPEINEWGKLIHDEGKYLIHHACGHIRALLPYMDRTDIDMIESISPPPTGNAELWEARAALSQHIGLAGGIEPTMLLNSSLEELEQYVLVLLRKMERTRFILANSDSCPPGVSPEKFRLVARLVNK